MYTKEDKRYEIKSEELKNQFEKLVTGKKTGNTVYRGNKYRYLVNKNSFPSGTYRIVLYNLSSENSFLKWLLLGLVLADILLSVISYLISQYIANVFGKQKENTSSAKQQATAIGVSAKNENKLADATKKAGKNAKGSVASFDEIEKLTSEATENAEELAEETADTEIGGGDVGVGFNLGINEEIDTTPIDNLVNRIKEKFAGLKETFAPLIETLSIGIRKYADTWKNIWSTILSPIIENYKKNIDTLWDNHLSKLAKNILDLIITIIDGALQLYNEAFLPLVNFLIDFFVCL